MSKIIRPKPIAPGARIVRITWGDGEIWEIDAVEYLQKVAGAHSRNEKRLRNIIDEKSERARAHGQRGGFVGGRPQRKPFNHEVEYGFEFYSVAFDRAREARAEFVKDLAESCGVSRQAASGWLRAIGIARK